MTDERVTWEHDAEPIRADGTQPCRRCGYLVSDYRNSWVPEGTPPMRGFAPGRVYVTGNWTGGYPPEGATVKPCQPTGGVNVRTS